MVFFLKIYCNAVSNDCQSVYNILMMLGIYEYIIQLFKVFIVIMYMYFIRKNNSCIISNYAFSVIKYIIVCLY